MAKSGFRGDFSRWALAVSLGVGALPVSSPAAWAQEATYSFDVRAQPLSAALLDLGRQARISIAASRDVVQGRTSKAVRGTMTTREALAHLLEGTGLTYSFIGPDAVRVSKGRPVSQGAASPSSSSDSPTAVAVAQDQALAGTGEATEIVVTGTRLAQKGDEGVLPATVMSAKQIERRGYTNLLEALSEQPAFGVPGTSAIGQQSRYTNGQSFLNFLGLGAQRTLTLVNGRRFVSSNTAHFLGATGSAGSLVDINAIPEVMVDRVETVSVGGAPIYGSDAIAGTVNIILKQNYDGLQVESTNGISEHGDADNHRVSAILGKNFADGRGNFVVAGEWNKSSGLKTSDRARTGASGPFYTAPSDPSAPYGNQLYYGPRYFSFTQYGMPFAADYYDPGTLGIKDAGGTTLAFNREGRLAPFNFGTLTGDGLTSAGGDGLPINDFGGLLTDSERYLGVAQAHYRFSDAVRVFGEAWYSHSSATNLVFDPYYSTSLFDPTAGTVNGNLVISLDNPFLNPADRAIIATNLARYPAGADLNHDGRPDVLPTPPGTFALGRGSTDWQTGRATTAVETYRFVAGVDGDLQFGSRPWHYEASLNFGHSRAVNRSPQIVFQNMINALNSTRNAGGTIVCTPGYTSAPIATLNANCTALNPFGQSDTAMQRAAIDYITAVARSTSTNRQFVFNLNTQGTLFALPGGEVRTSLGYEHRFEATGFDPGVFGYGQTLSDGTRQGFGDSVPADPVNGSFRTNEGFVELQIPLVSPEMGWSLLDRAQLQGAARYVQNSLSGGAWTYTFGGELAPVRDITFRGNFTRSIRSPAIEEVFYPTSSAFVGGRDPCDVRYIAGGPDPQRRAANCAAAGVPANFSSNFSKFSIRGTVSGNPDLQNETANSYTFGALLRPRFIPGLTVSADYLNISIKNEIISIRGADILNACYDAADYPNAFCQAAPRDANGQITTLRQGFYNAAIAKLKAIQGQVDYDLPLSQLGMGPDAGQLDLGFSFYHLIEQYQKIGVNDVNHLAGEVENPRDSFTANLNYVNRGFNFLWQTQYVGPGKIDVDLPDSTYQYPGVKGWYLFNASLGYAIDDRYKIRLVVNNVFDAAPPLIVPATGGTFTYFQGLLGRNFRLSVSAGF